MTDKTETHDINAEDLNKAQLLEALDQMFDGLQDAVDTDLRLKALDKALSFEAIYHKDRIDSSKATVEIAKAFLAFLKGE